MQALTLGLPLPIWNQNKGNIIAAQGALIRASKESHRVEVTLTNSLALAYEGYRNNLYAMESYRRHVLPNLVRYYRGIYARRQYDPAYQASAFGDLVFAQQNLSTNVQAYLNLLQSLWMSVVSVADFLQTDDLYHMGTRHDLPAMPDFRLLRLSPWIQGDDAVARSRASGAGASGPETTARRGGLPPPGPAGEVPIGPAAPETGPAPPQEGAGGASPQPPAHAATPVRAVSGPQAAHQPSRSRGRSGRPPVADATSLLSVDLIQSPRSVPAQAC